MADLAPANENEYRCPICDVPMQPDDICAADVNLGICHAHCLDGVPVVSLDTGELVDGPISTFRYGEEEGQDPVTRFINAQAPTDPDIAAATANRPELYLCVPDEATDDEQPRYNTKRLRQEIERARVNDARRIEELEREIADLQKQLTDISQIEDDHCVLVKGWWRIREVVVCPEHQVPNYLARGFRWNWRETAVERGLLLKVLRHFLKEKTRRADEANAQLREELATARKYLSAAAYDYTRMVDFLEKAAASEDEDLLPALPLLVTLAAAAKECRETSEFLQAAVEGKDVSGIYADELSQEKERRRELEVKLADAVKDTERLDLLRDNSWDLRCFEIPTGGGDADVRWRVIGHWQAKPNERTVGEAFKDDPRAAIDDAARWLQEGKPA